MRTKAEILQLGPSDLATLEASTAQQTFEFRRRLLEGALTVAEVCDLLGVASKQTIHNWVRQKKVLALPDRHRLMLPRWQFDPTTRSGVVQGLEAILAVADVSPFGMAYWLTARNRHLGNKSPMALLREGKLRPVLVEARALGIAQ